MTGIVTLLCLIILLLVSTNLALHRIEVLLKKDSDPP